MDGAGSTKGGGCAPREYGHLLRRQVTRRSIWPGSPNLSVDSLDAVRSAEVMSNSCLSSRPAPSEKGRTLLMKPCAPAQRRIVHTTSLKPSPLPRHCFYISISISVTLPATEPRVQCVYLPPAAFCLKKELAVKVNRISKGSLVPVHRDQSCHAGKCPWGQLCLRKYISHLFALHSVWKGNSS